MSRLYRDVQIDPHELTLESSAEPLSRRLVQLSTKVNNAVISGAAGQLILHAGAACLPHGDAVLLCGPSMSGKTTLTLALVASGMAYLTDEAVILAPTSLRVTPYRKPAVLKVGAQPLFPQLRPPEPGAADGTWLIAPSAFDVTPLPQHPITPALLVFPTYRAGADCDAERLSEAEAAYLAGSESFRLSDVESGPLPALARLARRAPAFRLRYDDLDDAVRTVRDLVTAA